MSLTATPQTAPWRARVATYGTFFGFLLVIAFFSALRPDVFLSPLNLRNILEQVSILALVASTMTVVMVVGDFDLSVGTVASLTGVIVGSLLLQGSSPFLAVLTGLGVGALAGALNGLLVARLGLSAFVSTLATMTAFRGLALLITNGSTVFGLPETFLEIGQGSLGPIPTPVIIMIAVMFVAWLLLTQTTLGRRLYAIGGNPEAAYLAGVNVKNLRWLAFVLSGLGAGLAGVVLTSRLASAHPTAGEPLMLNSIAAVFLGMTMFKEGQPNIPGTLVGVLILGVLANGLNILQVNTYLQQILTGAIIVLAVLFSRLSVAQR
jgi:ribose transport system permease protein